MATPKATEPTAESTFVPPAPEIVEPTASIKAQAKAKSNAKKKVENKPTGEAVRVAKTEQPQYIMDRNVKFDGVLYEKGTPVVLDGEMKTLFLKNGFCKMQ